MGDGICPLNINLRAPQPLIDNVDKQTSHFYLPYVQNLAESPKLHTSETLFHSSSYTPK